MDIGIDGRLDKSATVNLGASQNDTLRSARFRLEREAHWRQLDELVTRAEKGGAATLGYDEVRNLATGYRQAMNSLSVARDISLDRALIAYLESLCARAYLVVYAPQESLGGLMSRLLLHGIPQAVRRSALPLFIGFLALILGALAGYRLCANDPSWFYTLVPPEMADQRTPDASTDYLRSTIYGDEGHDSDRLAAFSAFLFSHNTTIVILIFTLGVFVSVPSFILTFYNGLILGAFFAMFNQRGLGYDVFAWLSIHGVTELAAIAIACAGGARLGLAVLLPGARTRKEALRHQAHDAVKLAILAALMLVVAAFIEGFLRQLIQDPLWRIVIGWGMGLFWVSWLLLGGRESTASRETVR
ncbi:stage II sporulation protein M [Rhizobium laguerreae]|uniref:stage II sporulation protein M n=1 Tax=Rhizobium laguerreae TaxID=1076926 RepID=UPI001C925372|nr:stage II sporulation protein M [Rhizobium laguerreae]MBY3346778.1 stage II sporulation protein M [Rhizobium laguerreae]MBY3353739.1 stage II sporulation protein M [Rhizobium laguerreae]MBY3374785.1 stage II sporulation protein M [Rhizobium laguerreae]MBY3430015.1 stage II sporulation protein M [Rhizobium laguerreae]MBY3438662.1 stage II sporulation protein M [Rhizobium laguerreae]